MIDDLQGTPFKPIKALSTKRRHSLMAIFKCESVTVETLLEGGTLSIMADFIATF